MQKKRHAMKCFIFIIATMFICIFPTRQAYAGGINSEEQEVIDVLSSEFIYEGITYRADPQYLKMAIDYLKRDDIDLTPEQKLKAFNEINNNVKTAVDSKYILPVPEVSPTATVEPTVTEMPTEPETTQAPTEPEPTKEPEITKEPEATVTPIESEKIEKPAITPTPTNSAPTKEPTLEPTKEPEKEVTITTPELTPEVSLIITETVTPTITSFPGIKEPTSTTETITDSIEKEVGPTPFLFRLLQGTATIFLLIAGGLLGLAIMLLLFWHERKHRKEKKLCDFFCMAVIAILLAIFVLMSTTFFGAFLNHRNVTLATKTGLIHQNYQNYQEYLTQELYETGITTEMVNEQLSWNSYYLINEQFLQALFLHNRPADFTKEQQKKTELLTSQLMAVNGVDTLPNGKKLFVTAERIVAHYYSFSLYEPLSIILENKTTYGKKVAIGTVLCMLGIILTLILLRKNHEHLKSFFKRVGRACNLAAIFCVPICLFLSMQEENKSTTNALQGFWDSYRQTLCISMLIGAVLLLLLGAIISLGTKHTKKRRS